MQMFLFYQFCWLLMVSFNMFHSLQTPIHIKEYCIMETFKPICEEDEVIVMQGAVYGRIRTGKCIKSDLYLGCSVNVLNISDQLCSGLTSCSVFIPNIEMSKALNCLQDSSINANLEALYMCQKVYIPRGKQCKAPEKIKVEKRIQHVASGISKETSCGLQGTPWILEAEPGQKIAINIIDFSWKNKSNDNKHNYCPINYGYILDMKSDDVINICGGTKRKSHLYTSTFNSLQIVLQGTSLDQNRFLLQFQAFGCPLYKPPNHSWIQKENETLSIGCVSSDKTWKLTCVDNRWLGIVGNCTPAPMSTIEMKEDMETDGESRQKSEHVGVPQVSNNHVIIFTIGCFTLLLCCIIIILGVYYIKRYNVKIKKYSSKNYNMSTVTYRSGKLALGTNTLSATYRTGTIPQMGTTPPPAYSFPLPSDEHGPQVPPRNSTCQNSQRSGVIIPDNNMYENVANEDSVEYYILENPAETIAN